MDFINGNGSKIIDEFTEVESGKRNDRPELSKGPGPTYPAYRSKPGSRRRMIWTWSRPFVMPVIREIEATGITSHSGIAKVLNTRGIRTARGGDWHPATVRNIRVRKI